MVGHRSTAPSGRLLARRVGVVILQKPNKTFCKGSVLFQVYEERRQVMQYGELTGSKEACGAASARALYNSLSVHYRE